MQPHNKIESYVDLVCEQIRWKKAHFRVAQEIESHIIDQRDSFMEQGLDEDDATDKAILNTGDAAAIGVQLDRTHRPKPQWGMLTATATLLILGLLAITVIYYNADVSGEINERLFFTGIGIAGMVLAYFADFSLLGKYPKAVYFSIVAVSIIIHCFASIINLRHYAQYIILLFPLALSVVIFTMRNKGYIGLILCDLAFVPFGLIALDIPTRSGFVHFVLAGTILLIAAVWKNYFGIKRIYGFLISLMPAIFFFVRFRMPNYYWHRLMVAFNPEIDPLGSGYFAIMTRELLSGAKWFGQGTIPEEYSYIFSLNNYIRPFNMDSLLVSLIALWGWIAFVAIVAALLLFIVRGFVLCFKQKSTLGFLVSFSIIITFAMQSIFYVLYNLGFQIVAPFSLPLISHGNTATIVNLVLIGFMLSVFRTGDAVSDGEFKTSAKTKFVTWDDGVITIRFKAR